MKDRDSYQKVGGRVESFDEDRLFIEGAWYVRESDYSKLKKQFEEAVRMAEFLSGLKDAYPENVFTPLNLANLAMFCDVAVDRISAEVLRSATKPWIDMADNFLATIEKGE